MRQAYTHDELAKELAALRWQELQWAHMKARVGAALQAQESQVLVPVVSKSWAQDNPVIS